MIRKAVIPIAGYGTRFLPYTKSVPKEMLPIIDRPAIDYIVNEAFLCGIEEIVFIINESKKTVEEYFSKNEKLERVLKEKNDFEKLDLIPKWEEKIKISFIRQDEPEGSGASVRRAKDFIGNEPFVVLYGDDLLINETPVLKEMLELHEKTKGNIMLVKEVEESAKKRYGIVEVEDGKIKKLIEKPEVGETNSNLASLGRYVLNPEIFDRIKGEYSKGKEVYLTCGFDELMKEQDFYAFQLEGKHYDIGNKLDYIKAIIELSLDSEFSEDVKKYIEDTR